MRYQIRANSVQEMGKPLGHGKWDRSPTWGQRNAPNTVTRCGVVRSARNANPAGYPRTPQDAPEKGALMWQPSHHPTRRTA
jgi:hypothetical protein